MQILFLFVVTIGIVFFVFKERKIDFFTYAFFSSLVYFSPGIVGYVNSVSYQNLLIPVSIEVKTYFVYILVIMTLIFGAKCYDQKIKSGTNRIILQGDENAPKILLILALIFSFLFFGVEWNEIFAPGKPNYGRLHPLYQISAGVAFAYAVGFKRIRYALFLGALLLIDVYAGNREGFLISFLAGIFIYLSKFTTTKISNYRKTMLVSFFVGLFLVIYKGIYYSIKSSNWTLAKFKILSLDYWVTTLSTMEPFGIQNILNQTIAKDLNFSFLEWIKPVLYNFLLFSPNLGADSFTFNQYFQKTLYPFVTWGMASNIWAECYAVSGFLGIIIFLIFYSFVLPWTYNILVEKTCGCLNVFVIFSGCYLFLFIHRTGLGYMFTLQKRIFLFFCFVTFIQLVLIRKSN